MSVDHAKLLINNTKKLLRRGATDHLHKIIEKSHPADLSGVFQVLSLSEQKAFFDLFDSVEKKATLFSGLEIELVRRLIGDLPDEEVVEILEQMPKDDVADLLGKISSVRSNALLHIMTKKSSEEVEELLGYNPKTAGGIMVADVIACYVVGYFEQSLNKYIYLATFMPIIMGMGGNVGTQTSASIMRGLATGRINISRIWHIIFKELTIGFCLGFFYGAMLSLFTQFKYGHELWEL